MELISFYSYHEIKEFLHFKHKVVGSKIFKILANESLTKFAKDFKFSNKVYSIGIDERVKEYYSHTAILNKSLKSNFIKPIYQKLLAQNEVVYTGKSLDFRFKNPRNFRYNFKKDIDVILVDDICTTRRTLNEAVSILKKNGVNVILALVLADIR